MGGYQSVFKFFSSTIFFNGNNLLFLLLEDTKGWRKDSRQSQDHLSTSMYIFIYIFIYISKVQQVHSPCGSITMLVSCKQEHMVAGTGSFLRLKPAEEE